VLHTSPRIDDEKKDLSQQDDDDDDNKTALNKIFYMGP
jgi:hypothetical protein